MVISSRIALAGALCLCCLTGFGQKGGSGGGGGSGASSDGSGGKNPPGFSIETEMFTYKAVEQNSEAIACDIARNLYGGAVQAAPKGSHVPCVVNNEGQAPQGIVLVSGGSALVPDFQIWRADMATMDSLRTRAAAVCGGGERARAEGERGPSEGTHESRGLGSAVMGLMKSTPPGEMISGANAVLGMFSSNESVTSVTGTVHDPALMNEVARQLRALNIRVLIPELYSPNGLTSPDASHSPYLRNLNELVTAYDHCLALDASHAPEISGVEGEIGGFLKGLMAAPPAAKASGGSGGGSGAESGSGSDSGGGSGSKAAAGTESHFAAVLEADAVAEKLGIGNHPASSADRTWQHLLWVKALESGGSVTKTSNLFGTKVRFGGGAVDTFAIFRLDGDLVCSGNVYSFQSPVALKDLDKKYNEAPKLPEDSPMLRSTCSMLPAS